MHKQRPIHNGRHLSLPKWRFTYINWHCIIIFHELQTDILNLFAPFCPCWTEQVSSWSRRGESSALKNWQLERLERPQSIAARFSHYGRHMRLKSPLSKKELKSFLEMCNVIRRLIPKFGIFSIPFTAKLEKGEPQQLDKLSTEETDSIGTLLRSLFAHQYLHQLPERYMKLDTYTFCNKLAEH